MFDDLPLLKPPEVTALHDELDVYLSIKRDLEVKDGLRWWYERKHLYPHLYRMALDYLSIPGKSWFILFCLRLAANDRYMLSQPHQLMSNVRSAMAGCYSHMCEVDYQFSRHVRFCASGYGVYWIMLRMMI